MPIGLPDSLIFNTGPSPQFHKHVTHVFPAEVFPVRQVDAITWDDRFSVLALLLWVQTILRPVDSFVELILGVAQALIDGD